MRKERNQTHIPAPQSPALELLALYLQNIALQAHLMLHVLVGRPTQTVSQYHYTVM